MRRLVAKTCQYACIILRSPRIVKVSPLCLKEDQQSQVLISLKRKLGRRSLRLREPILLGSAVVIMFLQEDMTSGSLEFLLDLSSSVCLMSLAGL